VGPTIYMDYQASTPLDPMVLDEMSRVWRQEFANPHAAEHVLGWASANVVDRAAAEILQSLGQPSHELVFTATATEANWLAVLGWSLGASSGRRPILYSAIEHKSVEAAAVEAARLGRATAVASVDRIGQISGLEALLERERPGLVSVVAVGNETGTIQDVEAIAVACRNAGAVLHLDASQAASGADVAHIAVHADLLTISSHKMYGPKGIGALVGRPEALAQLRPLMPGGSQQNGRRPGTVAPALCAGFARAAQMCVGEHGEAERARVSGLRDRFVRTLQDRLEDVFLVGPPLTRRHAGNACLRFANVDAADLLMALQPQIAAATQSACNSGRLEPAAAYLALGLTSEEARECIRFSIGRFTDESQIDDAIELIAACVRDRRDLNG
ncbi:MAG: cysteine desulfurase, partial [Alphaproteobacteria bacterium]|nr:cysteine desulfurase [Alphaproteobacteria bacterium]